MSESTHEPARLLARFQSLPKPEPSAGFDAYECERELALSTRPGCRENYERYTAGARRADIDYLPVKLDIENVSRCNFRCTMCSVSDWPKGQRAGDMSLEDFKRVIDDQIGLIEIKLQGLGEPLLQGDIVFDMIHYARSRHIWVRTTTNASLLHLRNNYEKLVDAGTNEIQISIDGSTEDVFCAIRRGSDFKRVLDNCAKINRYCRSLGIKRTKMWSTVQRLNVHQLEDLLELAARLDFTSVGFGMDLEAAGLAEWEQRLAGDRIVVDDAFLDRLEALVRRAGELGVAIGFWKTFERFSAQSPQTVCNWPFERGFLSSDMRVVPCCMISNPDVHELGAIAGDKKFTDVWNGEVYRKFREDHLSGKIPSVCRACYEKRIQSVK